MAGARCGGGSFNGLVRRRRRRMMADVHEYSSGLLRQRPTNASASTPTGHSLHERASSNNYAKRRKQRADRPGPDIRRTFRALLPARPSYPSSGRTSHPWHVGNGCAGSTRRRTPRHAGDASKGHLETPIRQTTTLLLQSCGMHRSRPLEERQTRRSRVRTPGDRASRGRLLHRRDDLPPAPTRSLLHRVGQPPRPSCRLHRPPQRGVGHPAGEHHAGEPGPRDGRPKVRSWSIIGAERTQTGQSAWQARRQL
jgi:hypothetical protein